MLKSLNIRNFALIDQMTVDFHQGFSVITGETGTGKSVLLGAISMLLGQRSDATAVREGADRCIIEGHFDISTYSLRNFFDENDLDYDEQDCIIRREVSVTGRSRAFINDTPVTVARLKELGTYLIDIHSQHQNLLLGDRNYQLDVLDILSDDTSALVSYKDIYAEYMRCRKELSKLKDELDKSRRDEDWLRYQLNEIEQCEFSEGEQEELEQEQQELSHAEEIQSALYGALNLLDGNEEQSYMQSLREAATMLERIAAHYPAAEELSQRIEADYIELKDCCDELQRRSRSVTFAPERLEYIDRRLALMYDLQKKHRVETLEALLALAADFRVKLDQITNGDDEIAELEKQCNMLNGKLLQAAESVTEGRKAAALHLQQGMMDILVTLGMPLIRFEVDFTTTQNYTPLGTDEVTFLFSANSISRPQPLAEVASGGEMARVMLALKYLVAGKRQQPTLIFDEIDTGISGALAERMGRLMRQMGCTDHQVISITHLPQVAALGASHYKVYKEETEKGTRTNIIKLNDEDRVREIAQMMSGETLTDAALDNARMLLSKL